MDLLKTDNHTALKFETWVLTGIRESTGENSIQDAAKRTMFWPFLFHRLKNDKQFFS